MELSEGNRRTHLIVLAWVVSWVLPTVALAQSQPEPTPDAGPKPEVPVDVYTSPSPNSIRQPSYPSNESDHEGWVELAFMVDRSGKPYEVTVIRSTGNKTFDKVATHAIEGSSFHPGTLNGTPVESGYEMKYVFLQTQPTTGAGRRFVDNYRGLLESVKAGDRVAADAALKKMEITNLYEDAYFGLATYYYASKWGDESQQLDGLRRAIARESEARYLPKNTFRQVLAGCMQLELQTHQYAEALTTWHRMEKVGLDKETTAKFRPAVEQMEKLRVDDRAYEVVGSISEQNWFLHLFKRHFRVIVSDGFISEARLRCDKRYFFFPFDSNLEYQVSAKRDGECSIELLGTPGTHFRFIQF
jgi:TonB family protein